MGRLTPTEVHEALKNVKVSFQGKECYLTEITEPVPFKKAVNLDCIRQVLFIDSDEVFMDLVSGKSEAMIVPVCSGLNVYDKDGKWYFIVTDIDNINYCIDHIEIDRLDKSIIRKGIYRAYLENCYATNRSFYDFISSYREILERHAVLNNELGGYCAYLEKYRNDKIYEEDMPRQLRRIYELLEDGGSNSFIDAVLSYKRDSKNLIELCQKIIIGFRERFGEKINIVSLGFLISDSKKRHNDKQFFYNKIRPIKNKLDL